MTRAPVLFRVDAAPRLGWEHMWRCLTFAAALQRRRRPAFFLSQLEPATLAASLKRGGNEWIQATHPAGKPGDLEELLREARRINPQAVVVDCPDAGEDYLRALRETGVAIVSIDSLAHTAFPSHLVVNPLLGPGRESYEFRRGTQLLLGARYAMVRPEIRRQRPIRAQEPAQPFRALVALGDDDLHNRAGELAKYLLNCPRVGRVDIVVRSYHPDLEALKCLAEANAERLEIISEPAEVPVRISRSHLAMTAGNNWSLELACVGVPQLIVVQSEVHWPTAQLLEEAGAASCLGWHATVSAATVRQAVSTLLSDPLERQAMARAGRRLIDGRGPDRLVTALELVLHPRGEVKQAIAA
jgi:spore coat polysaccharide biosynthesis predicted glycosyltransferase SpsG